MRTIESSPLPSQPSGALAALGQAMVRYRGVILGIQWTVVIVYLVLVSVPALLPLPDEQAHIWNNLTRFAQFVFWGIWWPFVMLSMLVFGRLWCGVFCPEGALTEWASRRGLGKTIPHWLRWEGWSFAAFAVTTIYGQLVSVYEYPKAALLVLGGSTLAAVAIGFLYGRGKRVWCRYLCPANGVFGLLARLAPVHFRTDAAAWRQATARQPAVDCAPLIDIRHLRSNVRCHACGRCSGHRNAVWLTLRSPNAEILAEPSPHQKFTAWEGRLLLFGVLGLATGAFQWSSSPWFVTLKQTLATWLLHHDLPQLLGDTAPWWLLTHYPEVNDSFTWLDGLCILLYIGGYAVAIGGSLLAALWLAQRVAGQLAMTWRLAACMIPLGGISLFLGLSMLTLAQLAGEHIHPGGVAQLRMVLLAVGIVWSGWLIERTLAQMPVGGIRRVAAVTTALLGTCPLVVLWYAQFNLW